MIRWANFLGVALLIFFASYVLELVSLYVALPVSPPDTEELLPSVVSSSSFSSRRGTPMEMNNLCHN